MSDKRKVGWEIFYRMLGRKKRLAVIGLMFTCISIFILIPFLLIFSSVYQKPFEKYDFETIEKNGLEIPAKIKYIKSIDNVSVNGEHPEIISYTYKIRNNQVEDYFETFDIEKISNYKLGDNIIILFLKNQTMIKGLKPYNFPFYIFFLFPVFFSSIGISFLLISILPVLKIFKLYKSGIIKEAFIISIVKEATIFSIRGLKQLFLVNYFFLNNTGDRIFGSSSTDDISFVNGTKTGDKINVFVAENDETKSCLVPVLEAIKYNWNFQK